MIYNYDTNTIYDVIQHLIIRFDLNFYVLLLAFQSVWGSPLFEKLLYLRVHPLSKKFSTFTSKCTNAICVQKINKGRAHTLKINLSLQKEKKNLTQRTTTMYVAPIILILSKF